MRAKRWIRREMLSQPKTLPTILLFPDDIIFKKKKTKEAKNVEVSNQIGEDQSKIRQLNNDG